MSNYTKLISVQSIIAVMLVGVTVFMFAVQRDVPESLIALMGAVIAFYFHPGSGDDGSENSELEVNEHTSN